MADCLGVPPPAPPAPLGDDDAAALRSLGIDLDAIREAVERAVRRGRPRRGRGAAPAAGGATTADVDDDVDLARRRFGLGGHVRFGRGSKKVLELSLREAIRARHSREIRSEHIALAVLRTDDEAVADAARHARRRPAALRADLEGRGRRTA